MSSNFGTWSPNDLILPTVESNLDYKFFFVKEPGSIEGLNINFNAGDWLVFIKEQGVGNWYKTSGGAIAVNLSNNGNLPDPGFYTKVRLDNFANIIDAGYIEGDDLPKHSHDIKDVTGDWETKIKNCVIQLFQNQTNGTVTFKYDSSTQTISANVNIDEETIVRNEWGELEAVGGGNEGSSSGSSQNFTGTIKIEQVKDLSDKLVAIDNEIKKNFIVCRPNSALKSMLDPNGGGTYLSVKFDGTSLVLNSEGELSVNPSVLLGGAVDGSDTACGAHTHTVSQITDFEEKVLELISHNNTIDINQIPIDGETIIINSSGHLACIAAGVKAHTHGMKDILDLRPEIADTWASDQPLQSSQDYTQGQFDFTGQTIGYSVKRINEYLKDVDIRITHLEAQVGVIEAPEPDGIEFADFSIKYVGETNVIDKDTLVTVIAGENAKFTSNYFYPANQGTIKVYVDEVESFSIQLDDSVSLYNSPEFKILGVRDSYYNVAMYKGHYNSMMIEYNLPNIDEGYHNIYFEHIVEDVIHKSKTMYFQIYKETTPAIITTNVILPENNTFISGVPCYNGDGKITFMPKINNLYKKQFINDVIFQYSVDNGENWITPKVSQIANNMAFFDPIIVYAEKGNSSALTIKQRCFNVLGKVFTNEVYTPSLFWNNTDIEQYRVIHGRDFDGQSPSEIGAQVLNDYDSKNPVPLYEMVIQNNIGSLVRRDYSSLNGPNYANRNSDKNGYVWCNFKFKSPFMNNLHVDLINGNGLPFPKNKNGTLKGIEIYVSQSSTNSSAIWVNGNEPYVGYGKADSVNSNGLDLFKSDEKTRYITFGQRPDIDDGYLYVKVGTNSSINLGVLVNSIKESINEWS